MFKLVNVKAEVQYSGETAEKLDSFYSDLRKLQDPMMGGYACSRH